MSEDLSYKEWAWQQKVKKAQEKEDIANGIKKPKRNNYPDTIYSHKRTEAYQERLKKEVSANYQINILPFNKNENTIKKSVIQMAHGEFDYLKYYRIVIYWASKQYEIPKNDLEFLFYLYNEKPFSKAQFVDFCYTMTWDKSRFDNYLSKDWIQEYAKRGETGRVNSLALYKLSYKMRKRIRAIYDRLNLTVLTSEESKHTKIFRKKSGYNDRRFAKAITSMNNRARAMRNGEMNNFFPED